MTDTEHTTVTDDRERATDVESTLRNHRADLEALADRDLPASRWARELLALLDEADEGGGSS